MHEQKKVIGSSMVLVTGVQALLGLAASPFVTVLRIFAWAERVLESTNAKLAKDLLASGELNEEEADMAAVVIGVTPGASAQEKLAALAAVARQKQRALKEKQELAEGVRQMEKDGAVRRTRERTIYTTRQED